MINQSLVVQAAKRLGLEASDDDVAAGVAAWEKVGAGENSLERTGGREGLEARLRMFSLFRLVKARVVPPVVVSDEALQAEYNARPELAIVSRDEAYEVLRKRNVQEETDRRWREWLAEQRRCSTIQIVDAFFALPSTTPAPGCPA